MKRLQAPAALPVQDACDRARAALAAIEARPGSEAYLLPEEIAALRAAASNNPLAVFGRAALSGRMTQRDVERHFNQAKIMGRAASRIIVEMLFEKAQRGDQCPFDSDVLKFLAKGFGIVSPSKPVDEVERTNQAVSAQKIATMSDEDLVRDIMETVRQSQEAAHADPSSP